MSEQNGTYGTFTADVVQGDGTADNPNKVYPLVSIKEFKTLFPAEDPVNNVFRVESQFIYEAVAASQTDAVLGTAGAAGDLLCRLIITVSTAATSAVSIKDGAGASISVFPNSPGGGVGTYVVDLDIQSLSGAWSVTTGAGSTVLAVGRFT